MNFNPTITCAGTGRTYTLAELLNEQLYQGREAEGFVALLEDRLALAKHLADEISEITENLEYDLRAEQADAEDTFRTEKRRVME